MSEPYNGGKHIEHIELLAIVKAGLCIIRDGSSCGPPILLTQGRGILKENMALSERRYYCLSSSPVAKYTRKEKSLPNEL